MRFQIIYKMTLGVIETGLISSKKIMQAIPIIFRCDASTESGWGHFQRSYALAEIAQQSGRYKVHFLTRPLPKNLEKKLKEIHASHQVLNEQATLEEDLRYIHSMFDLMSRKNIIVVIDHPKWTSACFEELKKDPRIILVCFDDGYDRHYSCDFLINSHLDAESRPISAVSTAQQLLGPKYLLLREEIHTLRQHPTERMAENFQFLITLGAADRWGHTLKALEAIRATNMKFETHLVVNSQWPHLEKAKRMIGNHPRIHLYEDPSFFPQLLARADLAFCGGGYTTFELAYLGVPMMTSILLPNQVPIAKAWSDRGISDHLGPIELITPDIILNKLNYWMERDQELENRGIEAQKLIDGRGKFRVLERIMKFIQVKRAAALDAAS